MDKIIKQNKRHVLLLSSGSHETICLSISLHGRFVPGNRKPLAFGLTVFLVNICGTFAYMFAGFFLINVLTGVPLELSSLKGLLMAAKVAKTGDATPV